VSPARKAVVLLSGGLDSTTICDARRLRRAGFEAAGLPDPTRYFGAPRT